MVQNNFALPAAHVEDANVSLLRAAVVVEKLRPVLRPFHGPSAGIADLARDTASGRDRINRASFPLIRAVGDLRAILGNYRSAPVFCLGEAKLLSGVNLADADLGCFRTRRQIDHATR